MSMPIVATVRFDLLDMAVLLQLAAPSQHHAREGQEHGRTIPLPDIRSMCLRHAPLAQPFCHGGYFGNGVTSRRARFYEPGGALFYREFVTTGCITFFTTYSPI